MQQMRGNILFFVMLLTATLLTGCAGGQARFALSSQAAAGQLSYGAATLANAKDNFLGSDGGGGGSGSGIGAGGTDDLLDGEGRVALRGLPPTATTLAVSHVQVFGNVTLTSGLQAGVHNLRGTLPDGVGVLTDPARIDMRAASLAAQITAGRSMAIGPHLQLGYAAGVGVMQINAATHVQSALIDVRGRSRQTLPYLVAQGRLSGAGNLALAGDVLVFLPGAVEVRLGVLQRF